MRQDIQSLRAIAVSFVLAFHLWDEQISGGYLGVDVFFIISGYIMCMLLSKASPIDKDKILTFYFRRIKRIVPLYLFLIMTVLFLSLLFVAPAEYHFLFWESLLSAVFCSNFIKTNEDNYFNLVRIKRSLYRLLNF
jgi:peptidoglycan/LPS O-acetylase OafA/YrhL